jgi:hypothetical protein
MQSFACWRQTLYRPAVRRHRRGRAEPLPRRPALNRLEPTIADDNWGLVLISIGLAANGMATPPTHPITPVPAGWRLGGSPLDSIGCSMRCKANPASHA